jgi:hypothetical protein
MYDQTDQRLEYPSYLQEASQLHPSKREQNFLTTMAISALPFCRLRQRHHCLCLHCRSHSRVAKLSGYTWRWEAEQGKTVVPRNKSTTSTTNFRTFGLESRHCPRQCSSVSSSALLHLDPSNTSIRAVALFHRRCKPTPIYLLLSLCRKCTNSYVENHGFSTEKHHGISVGKSVLSTRVKQPQRTCHPKHITHTSVHLALQAEEQRKRAADARELLLFGT